MTPHRALVGVSAAQLAAGLAGLVVAVRRRRYFDVWLPGHALLWLRRGSPATVPRDALWAGTAYSAPAPMLVAQLASTVRLARGHDRAARDLGVLGALMVPGYLVERFGRAHLRGWDPLETPVVLAGVGLAAAMAALGLRGSGGGRPGMPRA